ncbi:Protein kinase-like domain [Pseudocohnilembus persalinus]|uniref:Protein kinase-like domain n=1 Tax=Pseudocohnilembus persalinus TaxID=266149 RepID=A0A0V0QBB0_PSEPJ|nr:Protein kinase-like domain [Pseudocohnilembus persalinus]|eukprot:KRW99450.1 Protein kinase-like domain [Pseudocohnilembus persalinus]
MKDEVITIEEKVSTVNGTIQIKKYQRGKQLGKGGFAKCYEVTSLETKRVQAAKIIPKATLTKTRARSKLISEIKIHKALHNPNIVNFEHVFEDQENVYILLELCPNQTLNEIIKRRKKLHELECMCYVVQILKALQYLHKSRVIHRDLKLGNIFLGGKLEVKLGDFGLATRLEFDEEKKRTICGTPNYIAPEILDDKSGHSYPVDIWSLGVIIYTLLIGKPPFETSDVKTTYNKIRKCQYGFPEHAKIEDNAKELITSILVLDPSKRPNIDQIFASSFLNQCKIPAFLPQSSVACPLSKEFIKQYYSTSAENKIEDLNSFNNTHGNYQQKFSANYALNSMQSEGQLNGQQHQIQSSQQQDTNQTDDKIHVFVQRWVDYSNKYGLGQ